MKEARFVTIFQPTSNFRFVLTNNQLLLRAQVPTRRTRASLPETSTPRRTSSVSFSCQNDEVLSVILTFQNSTVHVFNPQRLSQASLGRTDWRSSARQTCRSSARWPTSPTTSSERPSPQVRMYVRAPSVAVSALFYLYGKNRTHRHS